ncbi:hypothetical protein [Enterococcus sp. AD013-P3]|uniref:hypothetical protein n=1 Tax=Enterococcus sp. AD013-P3 TaxID=3411036 RepID=UPI003B925271
MWINITNEEEINSILKSYGDFHDSFVEKLVFESGMTLGTDRSVIYTDNGSSESGQIVDNDMFFESSKVCMIVGSQINTDKIVFKFGKLIDYKHSFSTSYDNIMDDVDLEFKGYRFHFRSTWLSITAKSLSYQVVKEGSKDSLMKNLL